MQITDTIHVIKNKSDNSFHVTTNTFACVIESNDPAYAELNNFYNEMKKIAPNMREQALTSIKFPDIFSNNKPENAAENITDDNNEQTVLTNSLNNMINFFSEFNFTPSFRFVNTLAYQLKKNKTTAKNYINNYFALTDSCYQNEIAEKIKSAEFTNILNDIKNYSHPTSVINSRLRIYYGAAGTGKTTLAQQETDNRCVVCNASMLPSDLMEDFVFKNGQPDFNPSLLYDCMEKGLPIVLDEINLLPFDSLRFLQGITDGKSVVTYKNRTIHIKDGFQIIGTMNLTIGGATYGLPEPLVDRCAEIRNFNLSAEQLLAALN